MLCFPDAWCRGSILCFGRSGNNQKTQDCDQSLFTSWKTWLEGLSFTCVGCCVSLDCLKEALNLITQGPCEFSLFFFYNFY
jgi:hypothetical protein